MKVLERELVTDLLSVIIPKFNNFKLAERIYEISGVRSAALGFTQRVRVGLKSFFFEELDALIEGHLPGMHFDTNDEPCITQQRVLKLPETQLEKAGVLLLRNTGRATVALVQQHLFGVMSPAFGI